MKTIVEEYFTLTKENKIKHGEKTVVFLMVGAFYEVYAIKINDKHFNGSDICEISDYCDLSISNKQSHYKSFPVYMCGFRDYTLEKYVLKMTDVGYTCVIYDQILEENKKIKRVLSQTYSPGTIFSLKDNNLSNYTVCIWFQEHKNNLIIGISCIDIITGKIILHEHKTENINLPNTYDDVERFLCIYNPCEIIFISKLKNKYVNMNNANNNIKIHEIYLDDNDIEKNNINKKRALNCEKQVYIKEMISSVYKYINFDIFQNLFLQNTISTQSFVFLLNFINERNPHLIKSIKLPEVENFNEKLILENHSLKQLNVISNKTGKLSNLYNFLNNCKTIMGQRKLKDILFHPSCNIEHLQKSYDLTEHCLSINFEISIKDHLQNFKDFDKCYREVILKKLKFTTIYDMYENLVSTEKIIDIIEKDDILKNKFLVPNVKDLLEFLESHFNLEKCSDETQINIFKRNVYKEIDDFEDIIIDNKEKLEKIIKEINEEMKNCENKKIMNYIKVHETEKSGLYLVMTKKRAELLFSKNKNNKYEIKKMIANNQYSIQNDYIREICDTYFEKKNELKNIIQKYYLETLEKLELFSKEFYNIANFIAEVDNVQNKCYVAKKYNYCKPIITDNKKKKSFFNVENLRHPLVEHIQQDELYVANDIYLGEKEQDGICLFGTNAVGKTCFIKSIGVNIIMAQSGFYTASSSFIYYPYQKLFTRILNTDNMFKGLSTFAVEMCELRTIIRMADQNSLILGDELCSGTENVSAISIFVAGLKHLSNKKSSFIFATHFHEICEIEDILELKNIKMKHLAVKYEPQLQTLIYDRKIKEGPGESIYGLEVCKSLILPENFLNDAYEIRKKYLKKKDVLDLNKSVYNSAKMYTEKCEICHKNKSKEIHHLQYQKYANEQNFIKNEFHKNHVANLISICEKCHDKIHYNNSKYEKKKNIDTGNMNLISMI